MPLKSTELSPEKNQCPFIVWTLQRTGGSNLAGALMHLSDLPQAQQLEPFNSDRTWGHITKNWIDCRHLQELETAIACICRRRILIKHCVETVPWEVSRALARISTAEGYRHVLLYRKNSLDRLLSLHFARENNFWGPGVGELPVTTSTISVDDYINHERRCIATLQGCFNYLNRLGAQVLPVTFEDIFLNPDPISAGNQLTQLLSHLGLSRTASQNESFVRRVLTAGYQGTRHLYNQLAGKEELEDRVKAVPRFSPDSGARDGGAVLVNYSTMHPHWLKKVRIDRIPKGIFSGDAFNISGVVRVDRDAPDGLMLTLEGQTYNCRVDWSPFARRADTSSSGRFRFLANGVSFAPGESEIGLFLKAPGSRIQLVEVRLWDWCSQDPAP